MSIPQFSQLSENTKWTVQIYLYNCHRAYKLTIRDRWILYIVFLLKEKKSIKMETNSSRQLINTVLNFFY